MFIIAWNIRFAIRFDCVKRSISLSFSQITGYVLVLANSPRITTVQGRRRCCRLIATLIQRRLVAIFHPQSWFATFGCAVAVFFACPKSWRISQRDECNLFAVATSRFANIFDENRIRHPFFHYFLEKLRAEFCWWKIQMYSIRWQKDWLHSYWRCCGDKML